MKKRPLLLFTLVITILSSLHSQSYVDPKIPLLMAAERENLTVDGDLLYNCEDLSGYSFSSTSASFTTAGRYSSKFDFSDLPSGIYMCVVDGEIPEISRSILKIIKR